MANDTPQVSSLPKDTNVPSAQDDLQFVKDHRVSLLAGDYRLTFKQNLDVNENGVDKTESLGKIQAFSVAAERFTVPPAQVRSVFPPAAAKGDFWNTLPFIVIERSTLPWERSGVLVENPKSDDSGKLIEAEELPKTPTWLALLVFHPEDPVPNVVPTKLGDLKASNPLIIPEKADDDEQMVNVISVPKNIIPTQSDLAPLTHVRRRLAFLREFDTLDKAKSYLTEHLVQAVEQDHSEDDATALPAGVDQANYFIDAADKEAYEILHYTETSDATPYKVYHVAHAASSVIANRLPLPGAQNVVHLVSVESRYVDGQETIAPNSGEATIDLVSLFQWSFFCEEEKRTLKEILDNLDKNTDAILRLPKINDETEPILSAGFVPLRHRFREGSTSISWYHGPLIPMEQALNTDDLTVLEGTDSLHIRQADNLYLYNSEHGMFDVSYAAAWELGKMLTLQNTKIALALYNWKLQHTQQLQATRHIADYGYNISSSRAIHHPPPDGEAIWKWLDELTQLKHIPFHYLVPDEKMLPLESLRFFSIDRRWIACLRDGAFSIGRILERDAQRDKDLAAKNPNAGDLPIFTGFLMRSKAVSGYPDLQMIAYNEPRTSSTTEPPPDRLDPSVLIPIRKEKLSKDVLLVLFEGNVRVVDFFLPTETLHFGFDVPDNITTGADDKDSNHPDALVLRPRNPETGVIDTSAATTPIPISLVSNDSRVVNMSAIQIALESYNFSGSIAGTTEFSMALQLLRGNDLVRFTRTTN